MIESFNLKGKYILVAKVIKEGTIDKFIITGLEGKSRKVTVEEFNKLVLKHKVMNCTLERGKLKGLGISLRQLPYYDKTTGKTFRCGKEAEIVDRVLKYKEDKTLRIVGRILNGKECVGYILENSKGSKSEFTRDTVIEMIKLGYISNATYQYYNNQHYIKGIGFSINKL